MAQNSDFSNESSSTQLISDDLYKADQKAGFSLHLFISVKEAIIDKSRGEVTLLAQRKKNNFILRNFVVQMLQCF